MCIDYTKQNKAYPKDSYPLLSMNGLVDATSSFWFLSFMDTYLGYNHISMHHLDEEKMTFITPMANYCYAIQAKERGIYLSETNE